MKNTNRQERVTRANIIRGQLNLETNTAFTREYGPYRNTICGYFRYQYREHTIQLRFSQDTTLWTAYCPQLDKELQFANQSSVFIETLLQNWIDANHETDVDDYMSDLPQASPARQWLYSLPSVQSFSKLHKLPIDEALHIYINERGS